LHWLVSIGRGDSQPPPATGPYSQAALDWLLAHGSEAEFCGRDNGGFAMWISPRADRLLRRFCYQAAQVLAKDLRCCACGNQDGDPDNDAIVLAKVTDSLGAHFYPCASCADQDLGHTGTPANTIVRCDR
jgi:hypothetical protein